jgi:predicted GIY-YIG superfamily endonuclease
MSENKVYTVPVWDMPTYNRKPKKKKVPKPVDEFAWSHTDRTLTERSVQLLKEINKLKQERKEVVEALKKREKLRNLNKMRIVTLYALRLEDDCWYIGMSYNPQKRFLKHKSGKGAHWTKLHPPIEVYETRPTKHYIQDDAAQEENDMTFEYALKYGSMYVRGGGYVQARPYWPDMILDNEAIAL